VTPTRNIKLTQPLVQRLRAAETTYDRHDTDVAGLVVRGSSNRRKDVSGAAAGHDASAS